MKHILLILILTFSLTTFSQDKGKRERIQALKVAFITNQLDLSTGEAQQFWPIYNAYDYDNNKLRRQGFEKRKETDFEDLSENEAKTMLENMISLENQKHELREKFVNDLMKVLPAKKIIKLKVAEDAFNKRMLEEMKKRRDNRN
jgi:hypothetical protein